jgi:hypothetical protein
MNDELFKAYELYLADRTRLATAKAEAAKSYDQTILTFSAGAVALSITFLEKLIQRPAVTWLLYVAWSLFGIAILATLYSLLASQRACTDEICDLDKQFRDLARITDAEENNPPAATELHAFGKTLTWLRSFAALFSPRSNAFGKLVRVLNRLAGVFFFFGIVFFAIFAKENWATMKPSGEGNATPPSSERRQETTAVAPADETAPIAIQSDRLTTTVTSTSTTTMQGESKNGRRK